MRLRSRFSSSNRYGRLRPQRNLPTLASLLAFTLVAKGVEVVSRITLDALALDATAKGSMVSQVLHRTAPETSIPFGAVRVLLAANETTAGRPPNNIVVE